MPGFNIALERIFRAFDGQKWEELSLILDYLFSM